MLREHDLIHEYQVKVVLGYIVDTIPKLLELYPLFFYLLGLSDLCRRHLVEMYLTLSIQTPKNGDSYLSLLESFVERYQPLFHRETGELFQDLL